MRTSLSSSGSDRPCTSAVAALDVKLMFKKTNKEKKEGKNYNCYNCCNEFNGREEEEDVKRVSSRTKLLPLSFVVFA